MTSSIAHTRNPVRILLVVLAAATLAGCATGSSGPGAAEVAKPPEPPMTHQRAAGECWMATEKGRAAMPLDQRADIVTKCIDQKMKAAKT
jgi:type IV pilus biogenesis protein CpaD/CtpE